MAVSSPAHKVPVELDDPNPVKRRYAERLRQLGAESAELGRRDGRLSRARGITFLASLVLGLGGLFRPTPTIWVAAAASFGVFMVFVVRHAVVSTAQFELERRRRWCEQALARLDGSYRVDDPLRRGDPLVDDEHAYASDLDLFGPASLFEQLNTTQTPSGAAKLASWLSTPAPASTVLARQSAAKELATHEQLREQLALEGMRAGKLDKDARPFMTWARGKADFAQSGGGVVAAAVLLAAATVVLLTLASVTGAAWTKAWMGTVVLQALLLAVTRKRLEEVLAPVVVKQSPLSTYHGLMRLLESHRFEDPHLSELQQALEPTRGVTASAAMKRLDSLAGLAALRHNALIYIVAELLLSWDVWCAFLLDRWRARYGARVDGWLEALSELEALAALATFADEHPGYAWPELAGDSPHFRAVALGHPLIVPPQRVVNDVTLDAEVAALMITGSNMSGKSTMLRSVGIAAVLAQAGGPVCAQQLALSPLRVITSMRVGDALDRGASRFYMEVRKLKRVVDELDGEVPLLFLLDEVLHGTNSRERNIGAKAVVKHLVAHGAIGAVSSHDLGLVELESLTDGRVMNVHFEDHLEAGEMRFDYRMKAGPVSTSNALRLMREVGIRVEGLAD